MIDPFVEQILQDAREDGNGSVIAVLVLIAFFVVCGIAFWVASGGRG